MILLQFNKQTQNNGNVTGRAVECTLKRQNSRQSILIHILRLLRPLRI